MKLINNFLCGVQLASFAEALAWIERTGLNRDAALAFLKKGAPGSGILGAMADRGQPESTICLLAGPVTGTIAEKGAPRMGARRLP